MAKNPVLFPDTFPDIASRLDVGNFGEASASTAWVKQLIVEMFYGRDVPLFSFKGNEIGWGDGFCYFNGMAHAIEQGSYLFEMLDSGWHYAYAQQEDGTGQVIISGSPPLLTSQQLWWSIGVEDGFIVDVIPSKVGFGI
jgi:hypothetical protein